MEKKYNVDEGSGSSLSYSKPSVAVFRRPRVSQMLTSKAQREGAVYGKAWTRQMRSAGKLSRFTELPLDAVYQIVLRLEPIDLLHLTRVSRNLRHIFMGKHLWVAARSNIPGLPDCPPDLNEAQYASLLFENKCQACGCSSKANSVDYSLRIRACEECHSELVIDGKSITGQMCGYDWGKMKHNLFYLAPRSTRHLVDSPLKNLPTSPGIPSGLDRFYAPELQAVIQHYFSLVDDVAELAAFVRERREVASQMYQGGLDILKWRLQRKVDQDKEEAELAQSRTEEIERRLSLLGWKQPSLPKYGEEGYSKWTQLVRQPQPLTNQVWCALAPELLGLLDYVRRMRSRASDRIKETIRDRRIASFRSLWPKFKEEYLSDELIDPPIGFLCANVKTIICLLEGHGEYEEIETEQLVLLSDSIEKELIDAYEKIRVKLLAQCFPHAKDDNILDHPATLFCCRMCDAKSGMKTILSLDGLLRHNCTSNWALHFIEFYTTDQPLIQEMLKVIKWEEGMNIKDFDGRLKCNCDHPYIAGKAMTFISLVNHIQSERQWCRLVMPKWNQADSYKLVNDHKVGDLPQLLQVLPPDQATPATNDVVPPRLWVSFGKDSCLPCQNATAGKHREFFRDDTWRTYHLRAKHKLDDEMEHVNVWTT